MLNGGLNDAWSARISVSYKNQGDAFFYNQLTQENLGGFEEAGLRYTYEAIAFSGGTTAFEAGGPLQTTTDVFNASPEELESLGIPLTSIDDEFSEGVPSGRVALEFRPNLNTLFYGSVSTGFKSGGYYGDFTMEPAELEPFGKETLVAYEAGAKSTFSGGDFQFNTVLFYYDYDDIQTFVPATVGFKFDNLENARVFGLDLRTTLASGGGRFLIQNNRSELSWTMGLAGNEEWYTNAEDPQNQS